MKRLGVLIVLGANQGFLSQGVDDETILSCQSILLGTLIEIIINETLSFVFC